MEKGLTAAWRNKEYKEKGVTGNGYGVGRHEATKPRLFVFLFQNQYYFNVPVGSFGFYILFSAVSPFLH